MHIYDLPLGEYKDDGARPPRPQLARVQAVIGAETDPSVVWKKLTRAALVPLIHADSPERIFRRISLEASGPESIKQSDYVPNLDGGPPALQRWFVTDRAEPFSVEDAILIAADATGIEHAEDAVRTLFQRLEIFAQAIPRRMVWRVMSPTEPTWRSKGGSSILHDIQVFLEEAFDQAGQQIPTDPRTRLRVPDCELWKLAAAHGHRFPS